MLRKQTLSLAADFRIVGSEDYKIMNVAQETWILK